MENMRTEELRKHKASIKSKLMAAIAMLLVSTIMLSSTTYAWFVLSTAPEVTGLTTTVGSNGSLEIALMDDLDTTSGETYAEALASITSGVGDSSALQSAKLANVTWGNIVDLTDSSYGLGSIKLYPAALNLNSTDNTKLYNMYSMLKYPSYGADGRVANLSANTEAGKYIDGAFTAGNSYYGVRAVGTVKDADPKAYAFNNAIEMYAQNLMAAKNYAKGSLDSYGTGLTNMAVKKATTDNPSFDTDEVANISGALVGLKQAATYLEQAIRNAYKAYYVSTNGEVLADDSNVTLNTIAGVNTQFSNYVDALNSYNTAVNAVTVPTEGSNEDGTFTWDDIKDAMSALIDTDGMTISGHTLDEIRPAANAVQNNTATPEQEALIDELANQPVVAVKTGLYSNVANFTDEYTSEEFSLKVVINIQGATLNAQKTEDVTTAYGVSVANYLANDLEAPEGESSAIITTTYGYAVDLAFRSSSATTLLLTAEALNRVEQTDADEATQGSGTTFTIPTNTTAADVAKIGKALRVVFVNTADGTILGVAGLTATDTELAATTDGIYELHMYDYEVDGYGILLTAAKTKTDETSGETVADDQIIDLAANTATGISVLVYLDGNYMDSSMNTVNGMLNLQFASSAELTPMVYHEWVEPVDAGGEEANP